VVRCGVVCWRRYPYVEKKRVFDLYGEVINPEDYKKETSSTSRMCGCGCVAFACDV
jgi:hypothetical protein